MQWRRCQPVQALSALLLRDIGRADAATVLADIAKRSPLFLNLLISCGTRWLVIEGCADPENASDILLPTVSGAVPLYRASEGIYCAVGFELDAPTSLRAQLLAHFRQRLSLGEQAVLVPSKAAACALDIYKLERARKLGAIDVAGLN